MSSYSTIKLIIYILKVYDKVQAQDNVEDKLRV